MIDVNYRRGGEIGAMTKRIAIYSNTIGYNALNEVQLTPTLIGERWADIQPYTSTESDILSREVSMRQLQIRIRYDVNLINMELVVSYQGRDYDIETMIDDGMNEYLTLITKHYE